MQEWKEKPPLTGPATKANGGKKIGPAKGALPAGPGAQHGEVPCQRVTYHDQRGYHNRKASQIPRSFFEK
jgi:hypothetical protein